MELTSFIKVESCNAEHSLTVSARKLQDVLKNMLEEEIIQFEFDNNKLIIKQNKSKYSLQTIAGDEFPVITPPTNNIIELRESKKTIANVFKSVSFSMAHQDVRYYLNGLYLQIADGQICAVATDGHRLALNYATLSNKLELNVGKTNEFIIPRKAVIEIEKLCDDDEMIDITFYDQHLVVESEYVKLTTKLIEGKYPDYKKVVPKEEQSKVVLNRKEFLNGLQRVSVLAAEKYKGIKLSVNDNLVQLNSSNTEQEEAEVQLNCSNKSLSISMGFNVSYLIEGLSNASCEKIELMLSDPQASALILNPELKDFKYIVMPMRI